MTTLSFAFSSSGSTAQTYTVPTGVTEMAITVAGAGGAAVSGSSNPAGLGAVVTATVPVTPGHVLAFYVGGVNDGVTAGGSYYGTSGGGGMTGVLDQTANVWLMIAGGGGGTDGTGPGGNGGTPNGGSASGGNYPGSGATTTAAGTNGDGYNGSGPQVAGNPPTFYRGGSAYSGGGGGYYTGGAGGGEYTTSSSTLTGYSSTTTSSYGGEEELFGTGSYYEPGGTTSPPPAPSGSPPNSWSYTYYYDTGTADSSNNMEIYNLTNYDVSYTAQYTTTYYTNYYSGPGGGGSSYVIPSATGVTYAATNASNGYASVIQSQNPSAPTLQSPANNAYMDLSQTPTFVGAYNNVDGSSCGAYQFERIGASGTTDYWDAATSAWSSTAVWNTGIMSVTFPAGSWNGGQAGGQANGKSWGWSFNSQSTAGSQYVSGFASPFTVNGQTAPSVSFTLPSVSGETVVSVDATAQIPSGLAMTQWSCQVYLASDPPTSSGPQPAPVWSDQGTGPLPGELVPQVQWGSSYVAQVTVTETNGLSASALSLPFQIIYPQYSSVSSSTTTSTYESAVDVGWSPGYITPAYSTLPASVTSKSYNSFTLVQGVQFATQQSAPVQVIPFDTFDNVAYYSSYPFPTASAAAAAGINDFTSYGNALLTYISSTNSVLITQSPASAVAAAHSMIRVLPTPVLAEGGATVAASSSGGIISPYVSVSGAGNVYPAVRFTALTTLSANLQVIDGTTGEVLQEWPLSAQAGQTVQAYRTYLVGSHVAAGTPLQVGLVVEGTDNSFEVRALSLFDEGIEWSFSADGGNTFVAGLGVRNDPYGMVRFTTPGTQLMWKATFYRPTMYVNRIRMRPVYVANKRISPPVYSQGPTVTFNDPSWSILTDPLFNNPCPVPSSWFVPSAVSLTPTG